MVIEFNLLHIMILHQQERQPYVGTEHIVLVGTDEGLVLIMVELLDGYNLLNGIRYLPSFKGLGPHGFGVPYKKNTTDNWRRHRTKERRDMKQKRNNYYAIWVLMMMLISNVSCEHIPRRPVVEYDSDNAIIQIIQKDTAAHDSAFIIIGDVYKEVMPIKDTIRFFVEKTLKKLNQIEVAYKLTKQNLTFDVSIRTTRTNDTIFQYKYTPIDINPVNVAEVLSGLCMGLYDVNYKRDYHEKIRQWIFKNDLIPDSSTIENTNSILRQFNYSGKNEYSALSASVPIVNSLTGQKYRLKAQLGGEYYYLYAYSCKSGKSIKSFVESKITKGLYDAYHTLDNEFTCSNNGGSGYNVLFLIGIDKNWKYEVLPIGIVIVDDIAPKIKASGHIPTEYRSLYGNYSTDNNSTSLSYSKTITLPSQNLLINIPNIPASISSSVSVSYGDFEGNNFWGYNIPFYVYVYGDVQTFTIGSYKLNGNSIKNGECIRLHIKNLHIGDNALLLSATDSRGNKSNGSLSIPIVSYRRNTSYHDDDDYDDLEYRISDLENRMDDLDD